MRYLNIRLGGGGVQPPPEYDAEQMGNGFAVKGLSIEQKKSQVPVSAGLRGCSHKESHIAIRTQYINPSHIFSSHLQWKMRNIGKSVNFELVCVH